MEAAINLWMATKLGSYQRKALSKDLLKELLRKWFDNYLSIHIEYLCTFFQQMCNDVLLILLNFSNIDKFTVLEFLP